MRYCTGILTGLAVGTLTTMVLVTTLDPRVNHRIMRKGQGMLRSCKRAVHSAKNLL